MSGLRVNRSLIIPLEELEFSFSASGGPGGQHANKVATRAEVRWNVDASAVLGPRQRQRIRSHLKNRIDSTGTLRLSSDTHRSQHRNRDEVQARLGRLVAEALRPVKSRVATRPTRSSKENRLQSKRHRGEIKKARGKPQISD